MLSWTTTYRKAQWLRDQGIFSPFQHVLNQAFICQIPCGVTRDMWHEPCHAPSIICCLSELHHFPLLKLPAPTSRKCSMQDVFQWCSSFLPQLDLSADCASSMQDNQLCTLKGSLLCFKFLQHLDLSNNQLRNLEKIIKVLSKLRFLKQLNLQVIQLYGILVFLTSASDVWPVSPSSASHPCADANP